jgi:hypothetical protein
MTMKWLCVSSYRTSSEGTDLHNAVPLSLNPPPPPSPTPCAPVVDVYCNIVVVQEAASNPERYHRKRHGTVMGVRPQHMPSDEVASSSGGGPQ